MITDDKTELRNKLKLPLNKKVLLYTGSLEEGRGIDTIIEAVSLLQDKD